MTGPQQTTEQPTAPDTGDVKAATTREAILKALLDEMKEAYEEARTDVQHLLDQQEAATGARQFAAALPDGTKVGTVSLSNPEPKAKITDDDAFTAWVRETYPAESVTRIVKTVQTSFTAKVLAEMTAAGVARVVDEETGEVHDVPGVEIKATRSRTHSVRFSPKSKTSPGGGRGLVGEAWRRGELASLVLPALAPAEADDRQEGAA
ncbi:hypothetical protein [Streptomyces sp. NPDC007063]|uniref:hypothetical protein n=1 Tax=Streptomyces sp. NPDC007063 TaxID=3364772 RepID=UPI00367FFC02